MNKLILRTIVIFLTISLALAAVLFVIAGTLSYWQAWVFVIVFAVCTNVIGMYLSLNDPALLERRLKVGPAAEQSFAQRIISAASLIVFLAMFVICALSQRFGWSPVPTMVSLAGDVLVALGLYIWLLTFRENTYGASTVKTFEGQKVISTGTYAVVRHPMYVALLITMVGIPFALDAWLGLVVFVLGTPVLIWRILDEEKFLRTELSGYVEYMQRVRWRLLPGVW
jgi:protein-S-isoprenylcysteine O-methyltransferase Ste14